jgi:hypothetical protein
MLVEMTVVQVQVPPVQAWLQQRPLQHESIPPAQVVLLDASLHAVGVAVLQTSHTFAGSAWPEV